MMEKHQRCCRRQIVADTPTTTFRLLRIRSRDSISRNQRAISRESVVVASRRVTHPSTAATRSIISRILVLRIYNHSGVARSTTIGTAYRRLTASRGGVTRLCEASPTALVKGDDSCRGSSTVSALKFHKPSPAFDGRIPRLCISTNYLKRIHCCFPNSSISPRRARPSHHQINEISAALGALYVMPSPTKHETQASPVSSIGRA
jgi:hypothetical protein